MPSSDFFFYVLRKTTKMTKTYANQIQGLTLSFFYRAQSVFWASPDVTRDSGTSVRNGIEGEGRREGGSRDEMRPFLAFFPPYSLPSFTRIAGCQNRKMTLTPAFLIRRLGTSHPGLNTT